MSKKNKGVLDMLVNRLGMDPDDDQYYEEGEDEYYDAPDGGDMEPYRKTSSASSRDRDRDESYYPEPERERPRRTISKPSFSSGRSSRKNLGGMEVCVIKPTSVEEAREVTETLLAEQTVVLNLEGLDVDVAQRIIDFTSGSTYAVSGNLQKISRYIFIITPASVSISGDFQELLSGSMSQGGPQRFD